ASEQTRDRAGAERLPFDGAQSPAVELGTGADSTAFGESRTLLATDPGTVAYLPGKSGSGTGRTDGQRGDPLLSGGDRLLSPSWHRATAHGGGGGVRLRAGRGTAARHFPTRGPTGGQEAQGADRLGRAVLLAHVVLSVVPNLSALRLQGVSDRGLALLRRGSGPTGHDRQHPCRGAARHRPPDGSGSRDGRVCRTLWLPLPSP